MAGPDTGTDYQRWASRLARASNATTGGSAEPPPRPGVKPGKGDKPDAEPASGREPLWAGEVQGDLRKVLTPERSEAFLEWIAENEPLIFDAVTELANALVDDDDEMIDHSMEELLEAKQRQEGYPVLGRDQLEDMGERLAEALLDAGHPDEGDPAWAVAVALAVAHARRPEPEDGEEEDSQARPPPPQQPPGRQPALRAPAAPPPRGPQGPAPKFGGRP